MSTFAAMALLSNYKVITVTHHQLNVNDIGHFFVRGEDKASKSERIDLLKETFDIQECIYLETCNRVTFVLYSSTFNCRTQLADFFNVVNPDLKDGSLSNILKFVSHYEGESAIKHVFELASSMDSLVVGEREIFRQFRESYEWSKENGHVSDNLRLLERATVQTAKRIYHDTKIGEKPLSVVSLAMAALLKSNVSRQSRVILVGAGETNSLVAKFLKKYHFDNIKIYNRSLHNAAELSAEISAQAFHINDLEKLKGDFDIMFVCTSANKAIIDEPLYTKMLSGSTDKKTLIDLAMPRNIAPAVVDNFSVNHIDIEALKKLSEANLEFRMSEMEKAKPMILEEIYSFHNLYQERQLEKAMRQVPQEVSAIKERAINDIYDKRINQLDSTSKELLLEMMDYMEKKCISIPIKLAKKA